MSEKMKEHSKLDYHLSSLAMMSEFVARYKCPSQRIDSIIISESQKWMETNVQVIASLLKVVLVCGKQGLALRGHHDDHINWSDEAESSSNQGNFAELVRFRAEIDDILSTHLQNSPANAQYTSKTIKNEVIEVVGKFICSDIIERAKSSKFYTLIADQVKDTSNREQLSVSLRFVEANIVKEIFVAFITVDRITGVSLAEAILTWLAKVGLSQSDIRGQCYDGASNISGSRSGCCSLARETTSSYGNILSLCSS